MIEECEELIVALQHYRRGGVSYKEVLEEMDDVPLMSEIVARHLKVRELDPDCQVSLGDMKAFKLNRAVKALKNRMEATDGKKR